MDKTKKPEEKKPETGTKEQNKEETKKECACEECECRKEKCASCEELKKQIEEYKTKYLRAIADYRNYERRVQDQRIEWIKNANKNVIFKLLSFLDDLERAEVFVKDPNLSHVKDSFTKMLKNEGLEEIEVLNKPYDPYTAEVIDMKEGKEDNMVIAVLRKGYTYNGQLLRIAQVTVSKKVENTL
ncbi:MAG: nucleotide exchange factor GrpE [bacterium]